LKKWEWIILYKILIVVDMQNDFIDGSLGTPEAVAIVDNAVHRIEKSKGELILFTQDTHQSDYLQTPEGQKLSVEHCIEGTHGWQINPRIKQAWQNNSGTIIHPDLKENIFTKPVFGSTALVKFLENIRDDIEEIELLGLCTDICVISNTIMIKNTLPDIRINVNKDCCAGVTPKSHQEALNVMAMCQIDVI